MHCISQSKYSSDESLKPLLNYIGWEPWFFTITVEIDSHLWFWYFLVHPSWKCLWNDSVVPSEMKFIGMDFSHSNFIHKDENSRKVISKESDIYSVFTEKPKEFSHSPIPTEPCISPRRGERGCSYLLLHRTSGSRPVQTIWLLLRMNLLCSSEGLFCL